MDVSQSNNGIKEPSDYASFYYPELNTNYRGITAPWANPFFDDEIEMGTPFYNGAIKLNKEPLK